MARNTKRDEALTPAQQLAALNRQQVIELLLEQTKEVERLNKENVALRQELERSVSLGQLVERLESAIGRLDPSVKPETNDPEMFGKELSERLWNEAIALVDEVPANNEATALAGDVPAKADDDYDIDFLVRIGDDYDSDLQVIGASQEKTHDE